MKAFTRFTTLTILSAILMLCGCDTDNDSSGGGGSPPATPLAIVTTSLPGGIQASGYQQFITANGGSGTGYTWSVVSGNEPPGCAILGGTPSASYTGVPTAAGTFTFTVMVEDDASNQATRQFTIVVDPPAALAITTTSLANAVVGQQYSQLIQAAGGTAPYNWTIVGGSLGWGLELSFNINGATISGLPRFATTLNFDLKVEDANNQTDQLSMALTIDPGTLTIQASSLDYAVEGFAYSFKLHAQGGTGSIVSWTVVSGSLPSGLACQSGYPLPHCFIMGTPTASGAFSFTLQITDSAGTTAQAAFALDVYAATGAPVIANQAFGPYSINETLESDLLAAGGSGGYSWAFGAGSQVPPGVSVSNAGGTWQLTGAPSVVGIYSVTLVVTDSASATASRSFEIEVVEFPAFFGTPIRQKTVFVIDASGSMAGSGIATVRAELTSTLTNMTSNCEFDACAFGTQFAAPDYTTFMWGALLPATAGNVAAAIQWVNGPSTNPGGSTPTYPCLKKCCELYPADLECIFLTTDGYPSTGGSASAILADFPGWFFKFNDCRLHTVDLYGSATVFLQLLAFQGNGEYIAP